MFSLNSTNSRLEDIISSTEVPAVGKASCSTGEREIRDEQPKNPASPLWGSFTVKPYIRWGALYTEHCLSWIFYMFRRLFLSSFSVKVKTIIHGSLLAPFPNCFVWMPSAHWILKVTLVLQLERYFWTIVKYQHDPLGLPWHHFYQIFLYLWEI